VLRRNVLLEEQDTDANPAEAEAALPAPGANGDDDPERQASGPGKEEEIMTTRIRYLGEGVSAKWESSREKEGTVTLTGPKGEDILIRLDMFSQLTQLVTEMIVEEIAEAERQEVYQKMLRAPH
jgi:hypothetical protein